MQFHLNGFRPGDPEISEPAEHGGGAQSAGHLPAEVDVLIIGCGPAGLTLAGQVDGIACRTMEMFHAFGFSERLLKEASWI
jgi:phenol 2-monooxygenase (NADPH)